jgi:HlyD family secretion protein
MRATLRRVLLWTGLGLLLLIGLVAAFRPRPVPVDFAELVRGSLVVTVEDEGETRVRDIFVLSAPVAGRVLRIDAEAGDVVVADETVIARIEPIDPAFLDPRGAAQAQAAVRAAESAETLAQAEVRKAQAELEFARSEVERARRLMVDGTIAVRQLDEAERLYKTQKATYQTALAGLQVRKYELEQARAQLLSPVETQSRRGGSEYVLIQASVNGRVLRVLHESEGVVQAGEALVEIGDPGDLEIVVDLLSADAVKVEPGQRVMIDDWGGEGLLAGRVRRVEPFGFTKVSALGIEEQRVNVIVDLTSPGASWERLGHGYQVEVRIVLWEGDDVLKVPLTALFRVGDGWAVFVEEAGRARQRPVRIGRSNGLEAEIVQGLTVGDRIVIHPGDRVVDGVRVIQREPG